MQPFTAPVRRRRAATASGAWARRLHGPRGSSADSTTRAVIVSGGLAVAILSFQVKGGVVGRNSSPVRRRVRTCSHRLLHRRRSVVRTRLDVCRGSPVRGARTSLSWGIRLRVSRAACQLRNAGDRRRRNQGGGFQGGTDRQLGRSCCPRSSTSAGPPSSRRIDRTYPAQRGRRHPHLLEAAPSKVVIRCEIRAEVDARAPVARHSAVHAIGRATSAHAAAAGRHRGRLGSRRACAMIGCTG